MKNHVCSLSPELALKHRNRGSSSDVRVAREHHPPATQRLRRRAQEPGAVLRSRMLSAAAHVCGSGCSGARSFSAYGSSPATLPAVPLPLPPSRWPRRSRTAGSTPARSRSPPGRWADDELKTTTMIADDVWLDSYTYAESGQRGGRPPATEGWGTSCCNRGSVLPKPQLSKSCVATRVANELEWPQQDHRSVDVTHHWCCERNNIALRMGGGYLAMSSTKPMLDLCGRQKAAWQQRNMQTRLSSMAQRRCFLATFLV